MRCKPYGIWEIQANTFFVTKTNPNPMETQSKSIIHSLGHLLCGVICAGAVILTPSTTQAQNLFVSLAGTGSIIEFTNGVAAQQGT